MCVFNKKYYEFNLCYYTSLIKIYVFVQSHLIPINPLKKKSYTNK